MTSPVPTPARITMALDARELYGPEVDRACGVEEPAVDLWETGELVPTDEQLAKLAELTGQPIAFFFLPPPPPMRVFVCDRSRRKHGLTIVDRAADGTVTVHGGLPARTRTGTKEVPMSRRTAASIQRGQPHIPHEDPDAPGCCVHCGRPLAARNDMHVDELPGVDPAVRIEEARRLGEHD